MVDVARDLRVDFLRLAPSRDFETCSRAVKKLQGHLNRSGGTVAVMTMSGILGIKKCVDC